MTGQELPLHASAFPLHVAIQSGLLPSRVQVQSAVGSSAGAAAMLGLPVLPLSTGQDHRLPILAASAASQQSSVLLRVQQALPGFQLQPNIMSHQKPLLLYPPLPKGRWHRLTQSDMLHHCVPSSSTQLLQALLEPPCTC